VSSTLLTLLVLPALYRMVHGRAARAEIAPDSPQTLSAQASA
jgi:cobalt-zinc-cadmium resistance protein CzcA